MLRIASFSYRILYFSLRYIYDYSFIYLCITLAPPPFLFPSSPSAFSSNIHQSHSPPLPTLPKLDSSLSLLTITSSPLQISTYSTPTLFLSFTLPNLTKRVHCSPHPHPPPSSSPLLASLIPQPLASILPLTHPAKRHPASLREGRFGQVGAAL